MRFLQAKKLMLVVALLITVSTVSAQLHERIYIHSDKNSFVAGETVWFKVYLLNSLMPGKFDISKVFLKVNTLCLRREIW